MKYVTIIMFLLHLAIQGKYKHACDLASTMMYRSSEIQKEHIRASFEDFDHIEHRNEIVAQSSGITYVNDSKSTNINSTWYSLQNIDAPIIWITGGVDKGNDWTQLLPVIKEKVAFIILLGNDCPKLLTMLSSDKKASEIGTYTASSMQEAVNFAHNISKSKKSATVMLSPACASFDMFENYEDRGRQFKDAVKSL